MPILLSCSDSGEELADPTPVVWLELDNSQSYQTIDRLPGSLQAIKRTELSFEIPGIVDSVDVKIGDRVKQGQVLASLDGNVRSLESQRANARLAETNARLAAAREDTQRQEELVKTGAASQSRYESARAESSALEETAKAQQAELALARKSLADTRLRAPFSGSIARRSIEPGQQVSTSHIAFELDGDTGVEARFTVTGSMRERLQNGLPVEVRLGDETAEGVISELASRGNVSGLFEATATLRGASPKFAPGSTIEVSLPIGPQDDKSTRIPNTALLPTGKNLAQIFVIDPKTNLIKARKVKIERLIDDYALIADKLPKGTLIVERGVEFLTDGQQVSRLGVGPQRFESASERSGS